MVPQRCRAVGQHRRIQHGSLDPAGPTAATGGVSVVLQGHLDLEEGLALAVGVALGVTAAGFGAVAGGAFLVGHGSLRENLSLRFA